MSNKEWKPATSPADLAMRLENGELFNDGGNKVWYDPSESNPYRYGYEALLDGWSLFAEMTQWIEQPEWTKQLDKVNVWCQVSDMSKEHALSEHLATPIEKYDAGSDYPYRDKAGRRWKFAIPIENLTGPK